MLFYIFILFECKQLKIFSEIDGIIFNSILKKTFNVIYYNILNMRLIFQIVDCFETLIYINIQNINNKNFILYENNFIEDLDKLNINNNIYNITIMIKSKYNQKEIKCKENEKKIIY